MEGFSLNLATSSSNAAPRHVGKKQKNFRNKKNAKKKAQMKRSEPQEQHKVARGSSLTMTKRAPAPAPAPTAPVAAAKQTIETTSSSNQFETPLNSKDAVASDAKTAEAKAEATEAQESSALNAKTPNQTAQTVANPSNPKNGPTESQQNSQSTAKADTISFAASSTATASSTTTTKQKIFGTRKNPNKASYDAKKYLEPSVPIDQVVLEKPLESSTSETIFAQESFEAMKLHQGLVNVLSAPRGEHGFDFKRPTRVQVKAIPFILGARDVLIKSETGSGKTLTYLLPIVHTLVTKPERIQRTDGCYAIVLAPTRELCQQILETLTKLLKNCHYIVAGAVVGGEKKKSEKARLRKGINLLVATPGRLADHLVNTQSFDYSRLQWIVLDEADRLLDMGFEKQISQILSVVNSKTDATKRQNILVSATINSGVQQLASLSLHDNATLVDVDGDTDSKVSSSTSGTTTNGTQAPKHRDTNETDQQVVYATPQQLRQHFMIVPARTRLCALSCFLRNEIHEALSKKKTDDQDETGCKIVVFFSTCDAVDFHFALFNKCTWPNSSDKAHGMFGSDAPLFRLHGNISQQERVTTFRQFCDHGSKNGILLCTDVAARGLNLPTVQWIIQYDAPSETRDYVHRVGRTARSGKKGSSLLFVLPSEAEYVQHLAKQGLTLNGLSLEKCLTRSAPLMGSSMRKGKKLLHELVAGDLQYLFEQSCLADTQLFESACQAFHSFVRSYATHSSDTKRIFHVRSLHLGHIAKSFALREQPASQKVRATSQNSSQTGTLQKRKLQQAKLQGETNQKRKKERVQKRKFVQQVAEFGA